MKSLRKAGGTETAIIKEFKGINVEKNLVVELVPGSENPGINDAPLINFIEIIRE